MNKIVATRQEVYHFGAPQGDSRFAPPELPVWADFNSGRIVYGIPDLEGAGFKIAIDVHGPAVDPDTMERQLSPTGIAEARAYHRSAASPDSPIAPLIGGRVCQYENSSNGDYLIDRFPGAGARLARRRRVGTRVQERPRGRQARRRAHPRREPRGRTALQLRDQGHGGGADGVLRSLCPCEGRGPSPMLEFYAAAGDGPLPSQGYNGD
jgi:hypothetical protein